VSCALKDEYEPGKEQKIEQGTGAKAAEHGGCVHVLSSELGLGGEQWHTVKAEAGKAGRLDRGAPGDLGPRVTELGFHSGT
jgi:hypothetical protein